MYLKDLPVGAICETAQGVAFRIVEKEAREIRYELLKRKGKQWEPRGGKLKVVTAYYEPSKILFNPQRAAYLAVPNQAELPQAPPPAGPLLALREAARAAKTAFRANGAGRGLQKELALALLAQGGTAAQILEILAEEYLTEDEGAGGTPERLKQNMATLVGKLKRDPQYELIGTWGKGFMQVRKKES